MPCLLPFRLEWQSTAFLAHRVIGITSATRPESIRIVVIPGRFNSTVRNRFNCQSDFHSNDTRTVKLPAHTRAPTSPIVH